MKGKFRLSNEAIVFRCLHIRKRYVCLFVKTQMINVFFSETKLSETFAILVYKLIRAVTIQQYPPTVFDIAKGIQNCKHLHSQIRKQQYGQIQFLCFYYVISRETFHCIAGIKVATASYKVPQQFRMEEMEQLSIQINSYCNCILRELVKLQRGTTQHAAFVVVQGVFGISIICLYLLQKAFQRQEKKHLKGSRKKEYYIVCTKAGD